MTPLQGYPGRLFMHLIMYKVSTIPSAPLHAKCIANVQVYVLYTAVSYFA